MDPSKIARPGLVSKPPAPDASQPHDPTGTNASFTTPTGQTGAMDELLVTLEQLCEWADEYMRHDKAPTYDMPFEARMIIKKFRALRAVLPALSPPAIGDGEMRAWDYVETVLNKFKEDLAQGYKTRDKEYAVTLLEKAQEIRALHTDEKKGVEPLCSDCPPVGYVTDKTRCDPCPRRATTSVEK